VAGLVFRGFSFARNPLSLYLVNVSGCRNIQFLDNRVKGDLALIDGIKAVGFNLRASQDIVVKGNDISELGQAIAHVDCDEGLLITENNIHDLHGNTDGIRGNSSNATVTNNFFTDFYTTGTWHPDAIQWWTDGRTAPPQNILVEGNVFRRGKGKAIQFIFFGNHPEAGDIPYGSGIVIRGNLGEGTIWAGVTVGCAVDPLVEKNVIIGFDDVRDAKGGLITPRISLNRCVGGRMIDNVAPNFLATENSPEIVQTGNQKIAVSTAGDFVLAERWLATREDAGDPAPPPPVDPRDAKIQELLNALAAEELDDATLAARALTAEEAAAEERAAHQVTKTEVVALEDRIALLLAERAKALGLVDQLVTLLSAPAP